MNSSVPESVSKRLKRKGYSIIFESDTFTGKAFDVVLLWAIILSVLAVMLESVQLSQPEFTSGLRVLEWVFTILFTLEYISRILVVEKKGKYIFSFLGIIDFLAVIPTYLSLIIPGSQYFLVLRALRLLRVFRILKLTYYIGEAEVIVHALRASRRKIVVFLMAVLSLVIIMGTMMYLIEGPENGFKNIPDSIYWAVVTLTTVGYGDISPKTFLGKVIASLIMITGYAIIAVPTGIVTSEFVSSRKKIMGIEKKEAGGCPRCNLEDHDIDANYCKRCGEKLR
ncbi:MAG: ion transporter [Spirochaetales bacterium]|nr:ion transporter [Spirochaetales bacterium]